MKTLDALGFRVLFFGLLASLSFTLRGFPLGSSSFHYSVVYGDLPMIVLILFFGLLLLLVQGSAPAVRNAGTFLPLILLALWWGISGLMEARRGDLFAASMLQTLAAPLAALFLPALLGRYGLVTDFLDMVLKFALALAGIAFLQVLLDPSRLFVNPTATLGVNRSHIGLYMMVAFAVALYRTLQGGGRLPVTAAVACGLTIAISGSRASQIGLLCILTPFLLRRMSLKNLARVGALAVVLLFLLSYISEVRQRETTESQFQISKEVNVDASAGRRLLMWIATWEMITKSPENFLVGVGFTNYRWEYDRSIKLPFYTNAAHNAYLHVWAETGILGLGLYLLTLAAIAAKSLSLRRRVPGAAIVAGLVAGAAITGLTQETLYPNEAYCNVNTFFFLAAAALLYDARGKADPAPPAADSGATEDA